MSVVRVATAQEGEFVDIPLTPDTRRVWSRAAQLEWKLHETTADRPGFEECIEMNCTPLQKDGDFHVFSCGGLLARLRIRGYTGSGDVRISVRCTAHRA